MSNFKGYVSEIDCVLQAFDKKHPERSRSQQKEIDRSARVDQLRDSSDRVETTKPLWKEF